MVTKMHLAWAGNTHGLALKGSLSSPGLEHSYSLQLEVLDGLSQTRVFTETSTCRYSRRLPNGKLEEHFKLEVTRLS